MRDEPTADEWTVCEPDGTMVYLNGSSFKRFNTHAEALAYAASRREGRCGCDTCSCDNAE